MNDRPASDVGRDLTATLALAGYSTAVAVGFARVFSGWDFLADLILLVVVGHGGSFLLRRARVTGWIAVPGITIVLLWTLLVLHYRDTMSLLLPTSTTWDQLDLEIGLVREQFPTAVAPVIYGAGWAPVAGFALVVAIVMSDSFAFRAQARGESLVPGGVLFIFIAAIAADRLRVASAALLIGTGVLAVIALRSLHDRSRRTELAPRGRRAGLRAPAAFSAAIAVALLAGVIGPRIPGAGAEPLYDTSEGGGGTAEVTNPLVDIRARLTNRSEVELFRVFPYGSSSYWRQTTLSEFDGRTFSLPESRLDELDEEPTDLSDRPRVDQQIQVLALGGELLPAAAEPVAGGGTQGGDDVTLRVENTSSSLLAPNTFQNGDVFTVTSAVAIPTVEQLRGATSTSPPDEIFLEYPDDLPPVVAEQALAVTDGAATTYDRARALQDWFQDEFDYSLEVPSGHTSSAIESFLNEKVGYCEQFAATFAAMARTLGIPTRVAVGYTEGLPNSDGWYRVLGRNSHAWPEVWFDEIGWVPFEPTPGRGAPGSEDYTGLPANQDDAPITVPEDGAVAASNPTTPTTIVPPPTTTLQPGAPATTIDPRDESIRDRLDEPAGAPPLGNATGGDDGGFAVPWRAVIPLLVILIVAIWPWARRRWRLGRERRSAPPERVAAAWTRAVSSVEAAGVDGRNSMTAREWASATAAQLPVAARPMAALADIVDRITYARPGAVDLERAGMLGETVGRDCELWSAQIADIARDDMSFAQRVRQYFTATA